LPVAAHAAAAAAAAIAALHCLLLLWLLHRSRAIKAWIEQHGVKQAVVVGGGFIGLEMVENLVHRGIKTTLVEMLPQVCVHMLCVLCIIK
jgi:NADPH-dependent 2,4-dienoyl-CoA reductase/sulfur reductase-like enzyme